MTIKMNRKALRDTKDIITADLTNFSQFSYNLMDEWEEMLKVEVANLTDYVQEITKVDTIIPKTPKPSRKRIASIPEDDVLEFSQTEGKVDPSATGNDDTISSRPKRGASVRAIQEMKKQQINLNTKLRRPESPETSFVRSNGVKRSKVMNEKSEEEQQGNDEIFKKPMKQMRIDKEISIHIQKLPRMQQKSSDKIENNEKEEASINELNQKKEIMKNIKSCNVDSPKLSETIASRTRSRNASSNNNLKLMNESVVNQNETLTEPSMYEDAIAKIPMNSTMNPNTTMTIDRKMLNVTVTLDNMTNNFHGTLPIVNHNTTHTVHNPQIIDVNDANNLITDDESSPERKNITYVKKLETGKNRKRIKEILTDSEDEVDATPPPPKRAATKLQNNASNNAKHKGNILFSPYSKETVKKRVEAFEQAASYKPATPAAIDDNPPTRLTRTKTRAMNAAVNDGTDGTNNPESASSKMKTNTEDEKENALLSSVMKNPQLKIEKMKQNMKLMTTPTTKAKLKIPMSVNRIPQTPVNITSFPAKAVTVSKVTNVTASIESTQKSNQLAKSISTDSLTDKKYKSNFEEDARKKKEEALKALSEEKRRKREEKELKNKLAREANEKLEAKKRAKLEKEKEEKARQAELILESQRRKAEEKKKAQIERAEIKEKKRKEEEKLRLLKLQEQEETERLLAEQKKRELEAERRKIAEERAQKIAAAEAAKVKQQYQAKVKNMQEKYYDPNCYKLDSEPDESSDDEENPKHPVPYWSKSNVREKQLKIQEYIPLKNIRKFFGTKAATVDLTEYFVNIKKDRLKRTSSARWSMPRFSMMQTFQE